MSRKKSYRAREAESAENASSSRGHRITFTIMIGLIVITLAAVYFFRPKSERANRPDRQVRSVAFAGSDVPASDVAPAGETSRDEPKKPTPRPLEMASLKGRWQRPEEAYELTIRDIAEDGTVKATYFNRMNINVSQARATKEGEHIKLFVELRDVNYPGCTYRLNYLPETDEMVGVYYQAALGQEYQVVFQRME